MELRYWALADAPGLYSIYCTSSGLERQMPALASEEDARNLIETSYRLKTGLFSASAMKGGPQGSSG